MKAKLSVLVLMVAMSSMWMTSEAGCLAKAPEGLSQEFIEVSGTLEEVGYPCEEGMNCPDCLTPALEAEGKTYYLTGLSEEQQQLIDNTVYGIYNTDWPYRPVRATVSGTPYQEGSFDFIKVLDIVFETEKLPSLCDTWNVLEIYGDMGPEYETWRTTYYALGEQKTINDKVYYTLYKDGTYIGALRENENGRIYIYPSNGWQQEFLIYDFNAQVGDTLKDLYIGNRYFEYGPEILYATVEDIKPTTPRTFVLDVVYIFPGIEDAEQLHWEIKWIEGIGMTDGPVGNECPLECAGGPGMELLCAYKLGVQVYTSELGEKYGCKVDGIEEVSDTLCFNSLVSIAALQPCQETGTLQKVDYICMPGDDRCPCKTIALVTDDNRIIYLSAPDTKTKSQLEALGNHINEHATITGGIISSGEYNLISVETISIDDTSIHSLCDEWHMLTYGFSGVGPFADIRTTIFRLKTDTIINERQYRKLEAEEYSSGYKGAFREGDNSDIYFVPANSEHEYLLYAFNAQPGDTLGNLWIGGIPEECPNGYVGVVTNITDGTLPEFTLSGEYEYDGEIHPWQRKWIKGVGFKDNPIGPLFYLGAAVDYGTETILCAYKDGEQVYASSESEEYGCKYNGHQIVKPYFLCDEWNVLEVEGVTCGGCEVYQTHKLRLTNDTIIKLNLWTSLLYAKLEEDGKYIGALRKESERRVYYVPAGSEHEYLLYDFDVKEGNVLRNLWIGGTADEFPDGWTMTVEEIRETTPRTFVLSTGFVHTEDGLENAPLYKYWIEGVGLTDGPAGSKRCVGCADSRAEAVLCAYKKGEQVYTSELGIEYGCEYNYTPNETFSDTIPLYAQDDPGSSTVDPIDPNQVVVTLKGDELTIRENSGEEITYNLERHETGERQEARGERRVEGVQSDTFHNIVTVQLTEEGEYQLVLTNPKWPYSIIGRFNYPRATNSIDPIPNPYESKARKVLINGQLFILRDGQIYTLTGICVP